MTTIYEGPSENQLKNAIGSLKDYPPVANNIIPDVGGGDFKFKNVSIVSGDDLLETTEGKVDRLEEKLDRLIDSYRDYRANDMVDLHNLVEKLAYEVDCLVDGDLDSINRKRNIEDEKKIKNANWEIDNLYDEFKSSVLRVAENHGVVVTTTEPSIVGLRD